MKKDIPVEDRCRTFKIRMKDSRFNGRTLQAIFPKNKGYFRWILANAAAGEYADGPTLDNVKLFVERPDVKPVFNRYCNNWIKRLLPTPIGKKIMQIFCAKCGSEMGWHNGKIENIGKTGWGICVECRNKGGK